MSLQFSDFYNGLRCWGGRGVKCYLHCCGLNSRFVTGDDYMILWCFVTRMQCQ